MDWEIVNGITGIISAVCAVVGIGYINTSSSSKELGDKASRLDARKFASFVVFVAGWFLCCLSYFWIVEPYGSYITQAEYKQFFGIMIGLPAFVVFMFGADLLNSKEK